MQIGDSGEVVKVFQTILNNEGYDCGEVNGIANEKTIQAICNAAWDKLYG